MVVYLERKHISGKLGKLLVLREHTRQPDLSSQSKMILEKSRKEFFFFLAFLVTYSDMPLNN